MKRHFITLALAAASVMAFEGAPVGVLISEAGAQQMGNQPFAFTRNPSLAAQMQFQHRLLGSNGSGSSANGLGALQQYVTTYNSSSTSIGNLNEVSQILSGGSTGSVGQSTTQASKGNQGSEASTETQVDNSVQIETGDISATQNGTNQNNSTSTSQAGQ